MNTEPSALPTPDDEPDAHWHRRYGLAVLATSVALLLTWTLHLAGFETYVVTPCMVGVAVSAFLGGAGPGRFSTAISLAGLALLAAPAGSLDVAAPTDWLRLALFTGAGLIVSGLAGHARRLRLRVEIYSRRLEQQNRDLGEMMLEVELSNQQLQDQATELEAQGEVLAARKDELESLNAEIGKARGLLESLLEASPDVIAVKDRGGRYLVVNRATSEVIGLPFDRIVGRADAELYPSEIAGALAKVDQEVMSSGIPRTLEEEVPSAVAGGRPRTFLSVKAPLRDASGAIVGIVVTARDETERRLAVEALAASHADLELTSNQLKEANAALSAREALLESFTEHTPVLMGLTELLPGQGPSGTDDVLHVFDNLASARFFGLQAGGTAGRRATELGAPAEVVATWCKAYRDSEATGSPVEFEYEFNGPAGLRALSVHIAPVGQGDQGQRFAYVAQDVTERRRAQAMLAESERLLRTVTSNATLALFIMDEGQQCVFMNPAAEALTGWSLEETRGRALHDVIHHTRPDGSPYPLVECPIDRAFPQNSQEQGTEVFVHRGGTFYPVAFTASPISNDATGDPIGTIIEVRDMRSELAAAAELAAAGERLAETQGRLRRALEHSPIIVFEQDRELRYTWIHNAPLGLTREQVLGQSDRDLLDPEDAEALAELKHEVMETISSRDTVVRLATPGGLRSYTLHVEPLYASDGSVSGVTCVSVDITEREILLANTRRAAARTALLQEITAALSAAPTAADVARVVATVGVRALGARYGTVGLLEEPPPTGDSPADRGPPLPVRSLRITGTVDLPGEMLARYGTTPLTEPIPYAEAALTGKPVLIPSRADLLERYASRNPGMLALVDSIGVEAVAALPLTLGHEGQVDTGRVIGSLVFDFPEPRAFEPEDVATLQALAQQCAQALERARLYESEQAARAEAEEQRREAENANRAKMQFLANMSHELRTPLNAIQGYVQILEMELHGPITDEQRSTLERVDRAQRHLLRLINDVLNFSKLEAGKVEYEVMAVSLAQVMFDVVPMVEPQIFSKGLSFAPMIPDLDLLVWADPEKLAQVLLNLLSNAVKFTPPSGRVGMEVVTREGAPGVVFVRVFDTGVGIANDKQDSVFEPFVQVRDRNRSTEGTGLGLAISRDLARGMGGDLRVRSRPGEGAVFTVTLRRVSTADGEATDRRSMIERRDEDERRSGEDRRGADTTNGTSANRSPTE